MRLIMGSLLSCLCLACNPSPKKVVFSHTGAGAKEKEQSIDSVKVPGSKVKDPAQVNTETSTGGPTVQTGGSEGEQVEPTVDPRDREGWKLVWSDEFDSTKIDEKSWNFEIWKPGRVNNELQGYTNRPENARIEDGQLVIEARKDNYNGMEYTSARLTTQGKRSWKYGRIEAKFKVTSALGTWPAFWMMPEDQTQGWPNCGEIDIFEQVGFDPDVVHGTTHTLDFNGVNGRSGSKTVANLPGGYHVYAVEWFEDHIDWLVDDTKYYTLQKSSSRSENYPFAKPFHIIFNFAIGGAWGGSKGVDPRLPNQKMWVDYVRVYEKK
ncbi:MAG: glycoside hydrolase family 16 protein [Proteobacteria bacterium]|nr:MAG: glycoside hydrolase family 16 protein [Pseudomonadota bacterium]